MLCIKGWGSFERWRQGGGRQLSVTEPHSPGSPMCDLGGGKRSLEDYNSVRHSFLHLYLWHAQLELWWGCMLYNLHSKDYFEAHVYFLQHQTGWKGKKCLQSANRSTLNLVLLGSPTARKHGIWQKYIEIVDKKSVYKCLQIYEHCAGHKFGEARASGSSMRRWQRPLRRRST